MPPEIYKSRYPLEVVQNIATSISRSDNLERESWCVFDNTSLGYATENAMELKNEFLTSPSLKSWLVAAHSRHFQIYGMGAADASCLPRFPRDQLSSIKLSRL